MTPLESQSNAIASLEKLSGKPVVLQEDAQLKNHSKIHIATDSEHAHVLTYHPAFAHELPYLVCFQCGLAERALRAAPDERFNVASTRETYTQIQKLVESTKAIPAALITSYTQMIADGLGTQLRSMPIGIRIDRAIYHAQPELRAM